MSQPHPDGPKPLPLRPETDRHVSHSDASTSTGQSSSSGQSSLGQSSIHERSRKAEFYSPPPSQQKTIATPPTATRWVLAAVAVAGFSLAALYGISTREVPNPPAAAQRAEQTLVVGAGDIDLNATAQLKAILAGGAASAATVEGLKAVNAPALVELAKTSPEVAQEIQSGRRTLYRVHLLDFMHQDGDHAQLFVNGMSYGDIPLQNAGSEILIPLAAGTPAQMKLLATVDGGGGVTVGFVSSLGEARTRIMQVGDYDQWQVIVK